MERLKLFATNRGWWGLIGVVSAYLLVLLVQFYTSGAFDLNDLITWAVCVICLPVIINTFENDQLVVIKIGTLGLLAVVTNVQLKILDVIYEPGAGNGFQMVGFFGLVLAAIVVLSYFDIKKTGGKPINYIIVWVGFLFFGGLLGTVIVAAIT